MYICVYLKSSSVRRGKSGEPRKKKRDPTNSFIICINSKECTGEIVPVIGRERDIDREREK